MEGGSRGGSVPLLLLFLLSFSCLCSCTPVWDDNGYLVFCPCMGRFGNQAAHYLGAMAFAKDINRTLVLPPWRTYVRQRNVPFEEWFRPEAVTLYHRAITMAEFMTHFGDKWTERIGYCYKPYNPDAAKDCQMKNGNPFGPFWNELGVNFTKSEIITLSYDTSHPQIKQQWLERYPSSEHPVIAMKGAPASFPMKKHHRRLQRYLVWSEYIASRGNEFINNTMKNSKYIGIHLRMGSDWQIACSRGKGVRSFFESLQCLEEEPEEVTVDDSICIPKMEDIIADIKYVLSITTDVKSIYIATDVQHSNILKDFNTQLGQGVKIYSLNQDLPQLDLYLLGRSDYFIGNCVSSFTAFVKRERDVAGLHSSFWGRIRTQLKDEL
ncbi:PREDICTED: GDP-fucose protein O-fucosyltransferase 1-like isoform X1 [Amphimedon queenslandica]|uniref:GDP-fucose protein O-fucosyltransferase 1 n=1 Tax=Amphimedon queenslandica TaxID=400682 RepID=A0AAN0J6I8_AMPQE|nr:PREDICTED: GDP-fucose protein O-fucosyltransferase 1-like isoform X1 [Amphimedon queenslandica]|eukprot:XP_019852336.1 PREDICTED: GDP-fucose protein O-fucosyltransferase 1-like isoform X1 [Amphimedon queenslandica]